MSTVEPPLKPKRSFPEKAQEKIKKTSISISRSASKLVVSTSYIQKAARRKSGTFILTLLIIILLGFLILVCGIIYVYLVGSPTLLDPCTDFYNYSCAWWFQGYPLYGILMGKPLVLIKNRTKELLESDDIEINVKYRDVFFEKARKMYATCKDDFEDDSLYHLHEVMNHIGSWPIFESSLGSENEFQFSNITNRLGILHQMGFSDGVFDVSITKSRESHQLLLTIEPRQLNLDENVFRHENDYDKLGIFIQRCIELLIQYTPREELDFSVKEIINLKKKIDNVLWNSSKYSDLEIHGEEISLEDLNERSKVDWVHFFQMMFENEANIAVDTIVIVKHMTSIFEIENLFNTDTRISLNLLGWQAIAQFVWYTKPELAFIDERYIPVPHIVYSPSLRPFSVYAEDYQIQPRTSKLERCLDSVVQCFPNTILKVYADYYIKKTVKRDLTNFVESITKAVITRLNKLKWLSQTYKKLIIEEFSNITTVFGSQFNLAQLIQLENEIPLNLSHVANVVTCQRVYTKFKLLSLINQTTYNPLDNLYSVGTYYEYLAQTLNVLTGLTQPPLYDTAQLGAVNYGSFGTVISQVLMLALQCKARQFIVENKTNLWISDESFYTKMMGCFFSQYTGSEFSSEDSPGKSAFRDYIANEGSLRVSFYAFKRWLESHPKEASGLTKLVVVELTPDQLFFLSYAMMYCTPIERNVMSYLLADKKKVPSVFVNGPLRNMDEFRHAFKCRTNKVKDDDQCILW